MRADRLLFALAVVVLVGASGARAQDSLQGLRDRSNAQEASEERIAQAMEVVEQARRELDQAREPGPNDWMTVQGAAGAGTRRVLRPEFLARLAALEENVRRAQAALERARREAP